MHLYKTVYVVRFLRKKLHQIRINPKGLQLLSWRNQTIRFAINYLVSNNSHYVILDICGQLNLKALQQKKKLAHACKISQANFSAIEKNRREVGARAFFFLQSLKPNQDL